MLLMGAWLHRADGDKVESQIKKKKQNTEQVFFILARSSLWLNTSAVFPLKTQHFGWCENLCQEMPPREQNMYQVIMDVITGSNICLFFPPWLSFNHSKF